MASVSDGELIRRALQEIVDSTLASPLAVSARETALKLLQWSLEPANHQEFFSFAKELISTLQKSAKELENAKRSLATRRERMWSGFHALRTTGTFKAMWEDFLERSIHAMACPTFYQHVVDLVFHAHIKARYPISQPAQTAEDDSLNYEERNALRYAAGYVPRALRKKLEQAEGGRVAGVGSTAG